MCHIVDDGDFEFAHETTPTARKSHQCGECHRLIPKGDRYTRVSGKSGGSLWTCKAHMICMELAGYIQIDLCRQDAFVFGQLVGDVAEHATEHPELVGRLAAIQDRYEKIRETIGC